LPHVVRISVSSSPAGLRRLDFSPPRWNCRRNTSEEHRDRQNSSSQCPQNAQHNSLPHSTVSPSAHLIVLVKSRNSLVVFSPRLSLSSPFLAAGRLSSPTSWAHSSETCRRLAVSSLPYESETHVGRRRSLPCSFRR